MLVIEAAEDHRLRNAWHIARCVKALQDDKLATITDVLAALGWTERQIQHRLYSESQRPMSGLGG